MCVLIGCMTVFCMQNIVCMHMFVSMWKGFTWIEMHSVSRFIHEVNIHPNHLQYKLLLSHSIAFKRKRKWELSLMVDRKTGVVFMYVCRQGLGWRGYRSRLSAQLSHEQGERLKLQKLFYLEWAGIWIDWLLKLLFLQELWEAQKRKPITSCQSLLSK